MPKRVFIIHGWDGYPENCWFPWLKSELEKKGFEVIIPVMPHPAEPTIEDWVNYLSHIVGEPDKNTYLIGHSVGCQTILRYLEQIKKPVGGVVCVAGWFRLLHLATEEEKEVAKPWLESKMDYQKIKRKAGPIIAIFSDDDPDVDLGDKELFEKHLNAKTILEHNKGYFDDDAGIKKLPSALGALLEITEKNS